jgi:hypothetical protein
VTLLRLAVSALVVAGCVGPYPAGPRSRDPGPPSPASAPPGPPTLLLAAHAQPPAPADQEFALPVTGAVHLLFSRPVDPVSLAPHRFVLALGDGHRMTPVAAVISASERDEQRSVALLLSDARVAAGKPAVDPISVTITGLVHDVEGRVLEGASVDVAPRTTPVYPVAVEEVPTSATCRGFDRAVRVLWSAPVSRPEAAPAPQVVVDGPATVAPQAVDDADDPAPDNVLDLCLRGAAAPRRVLLPEGAAVDLRGAPTARGERSLLPVPQDMS